MKLVMNTKFRVFLSPLVGALFIASLLSTNTVSAQLKRADFVAKSYKNKAGEELLYRQLDVKNVKANQKYPLVLFLHGAGSRGDDNTRQMRAVQEYFPRAGIGTKYPCYCIAPQVPKKKYWAGKTMDLTLEMIDQFVKNNQVDTSRIYVTGASMGGHGSWEAIRRRPNFFAAAVPICGGGRVDSAKKIANVPLWVFHGAIDNVVNVERSRKMIKAIKAVGGNPKYTEYPKVKHDSWDNAYTNAEMWQWMFDQKLKPVEKAKETEKT